MFLRVLALWYPTLLLRVTQGQDGAPGVDGGTRLRNKAAKKTQNKAQFGDLFLIASHLRLALVHSYTMFPPLISVISVSVISGGLARGRFDCASCRRY
jgi:hypothetical protein